MTRTKKMGALLALFTLAFVLCGCRNDEEGQQSPSRKQPAAHSTPPSVSTTGDATSAGPSPTGSLATAEQSVQPLAQMNEGERTKAVEAGTLKGMLPANLSGMERTRASAERNPLMGIDVTAANARYETPNGGSICITITDAGNLPDPMRAGMAAWAVVAYDRQTGTGYEKSGTYGGFKSMEEYDRQSRCGAIRVFVADRFVVEVEGSSITMDAIQEALRAMDLVKMASL